MIDKKKLTERDICTKYITPAIEKAGWDKMSGFLEEAYFTDGRIYVRGRLTARGQAKKADYILYYKPNIPVAIIEAKDNNHSIRSGIQQALDYAEILDIPCVFSSNGDGFLFHDKTAEGENVETELDMDSFPPPGTLWQKYKKYKGISSEKIEQLATQDYFYDGSGRKPRYYQQIAINRSVEAIAKGNSRILIVMATGTGKTYVAFQIIYRLWKAGAKKRILFLADRNNLIDQTRRNDFKHFRDKMTVVRHHEVDKSYEIYLALYQGLTGNEEERNIYKQFSREFFDLIIVDECHRGSAEDNSAWREILEYFHGATQIGLTATPKETDTASNIEYFGEPVYLYSLRQGIDDGFLAPYRVLRVGLNVDMEGWRPEQGKTDIDGNPVEDRIYNRSDFDRNLVIDERTDTVAAKLTEFLKGYDRYAKTIVFCVDINHAERMRTALINQNPDLARDNHKYVMQITGDNDEGKRELDNFTNPEETHPVIVTTSELLTTGVDALTCKVIVLDSNIKSMTKFKQIIGRGTRIYEEFNKLFFTILDFRNATDLFADPLFDGDPIRVKPLTEQEDLSHIIDEEEQSTEPIIDLATGEEIEIKVPSLPEVPVEGEETEKAKRAKVYVNGVDVSILISREMYFDQKGKPITISLKDHTREIITGQYATLGDFLTKWNSTDRKEAIIRELEEQGVMVEALEKAVDRQVDLFDLICHVAYDQPPLTRKERAENVKKRDYFTKYGEQSRQVLEVLLDKYADEGIENLERIEVLKVKPFPEMFGSPMEIIKEFGNKQRYMNAVRELEDELYKVGS
jgi:type I restriction enzyme R subunit